MTEENKRPTYFELCGQVTEPKELWVHVHMNGGEVKHCHQGDQCLRADGWLCVKFLRAHTGEPTPERYYGHGESHSMEWWDKFHAKDRRQTWQFGLALVAILGGAFMLLTWGLISTYGKCS